MTMESIKIPTDIQNFRQMVAEGFLFVDKSLLIRDILNNGMKKIIIGNPKRVGKTLALSMIDRFFNIKYSDEESKKDSFQDLKVESCPEYNSWVELGYRNGFPIIKLDMSSLEFNSLESFKSALLNKIKYLLNVEHGYILKSEKVPEYLKKHIILDESGKTLGLGESMDRLCTAISIHHGVKPIVLIDEYDSPFYHPSIKNWSDELDIVYGDFLRITTKNCENTSMVIIAGAEIIITRELCETLNILRTIDSSNSFNQYFGINPDETMGLISSYVDRRYSELDSTERMEISEQKYMDVFSACEDKDCESDVIVVGDLMSYLEFIVLNDDL